MQVVTRKRDFTRKTKEEEIAAANAQTVEMESEAVREEAEKVEAANEHLDRLVN